jgi:hypothetical protein
MTAVLVSVMNSDPLAKLIYSVRLLLSFYQDQANPSIPGSSVRQIG